MVLRSFLFSLQASYRFLISTCYFDHLNGLSAENMIPDLLSSAISIEKVSFRSVIVVHHCAQLVHFSTENTILSSKSRRDRFKTAIISWWFEHVFTLKSLLERLKRDFDGSKTVSFQFTRNLWVSHFTPGILHAKTIIRSETIFFATARIFLEPGREFNYWKIL